MEEPKKIQEGKVIVLRPVYRSVDPLVHNATMMTFVKGGVVYASREGDAIISHSRNILTSVARETDAEWFLFWDDDVIPPVGNHAWYKGKIPQASSIPDAFLEVNGIERMKGHGVKIVGGLYYGRSHPYSPIASTTNENSLREIHAAPRDKIVEVDWVGTGFLLIHRSVFDDMERSYPELAPKNTPKTGEEGKTPKWTQVWDFFATTEDAAEDVSFCRRANKIGHQVYLDLGVVCGHAGTYVFGPWDRPKSDPPQVQGFKRKR